MKDCIIYATELDIFYIVHENSQRAILDPEAKETYRKLFYRDNERDKDVVKKLDSLKQIYKPS